MSDIERIQHRNYLTLETVSEIKWTQYREISDMMRLHEAALEEVGKRVFCDFDSQVYYRLLHNMLWSGIDKEKISNYLKIFLHHQKLDFAEIRRDEKFLRKDANTLYVPKDGRESASTLESIYQVYLKPKSVREKNDMYGCMLESEDDGYYYRGKRIEHIVFLCDNFESGIATIRMLKAYLDIETENESAKEKEKLAALKASRQKYFLDVSDAKEESKDQSFPDEVALKAIIEKNACTIEVHGYYGTERGKEAIEDFFQKQRMKQAAVTYEREITQCALQIQDEIKTIWPCSVNKKIYTVVREFNMPKRNVFPDEMLMDPSRAICMFVKKVENGIG